MKLFDWLRKDSAPRLKNKSGGMAWVKRAEFDCGAEKLVGSAVKTVSVGADGMWLIEPYLGFIATAPQRFPDGALYLPGQAVVIGRIHDCALEPWKEDGVREEDVRALYAPNLPTKETA